MTATANSAPNDPNTPQLTAGAIILVPRPGDQLVREPTRPNGRTKELEENQVMPFVYRLDTTGKELRLQIAKPSTKPCGLIIFAPSELKEGDKLRVKWVHQQPPNYSKGSPKLRPNPESKRVKCAFAELVEG